MPQILKAGAEYSKENLIRDAAAFVSGGGVIAYPTETFYGLGADATNNQAINRIFEIKGRNFHNPVSVIIGHAQDINPLVRNITDSARKLMDAFWPGPLTIIFEASGTVSPLLTANTGKIGIRLSSNDIARGIAEKTGKPLTATSANLSGAPECEDVDQVIRQIGDQIEAIVDTGKTESRIGSTILDASCEPVQIIRTGLITREIIQNYVALK
jgi:L-threonylcarbamoyladenylate synthase